MLFVSHLIQVYIARDRVDLRKSFHGLSILVQDVLRLNPLSGHLFVFFNKRLDKVKVLYWDKTGFCLWQKRLERGRFKVGLFQELYWSLSHQEFQMLIAGVDIKHLPVPTSPSFAGYRVG
jgi:transposase